MIEREDLDGVRILRLAHGKANAMDLEMLGALASELEALDRDDVRAGVLTGAGRMFSAGVDLKRVLDGGPDYVRVFLPALERALLAAFTLGKPLVAAINGHAIAGGFVIACACDRRIAADGPGRLGLPELQVGVPFPTLVIEVLRTALPPPRLQEMLLCGATLEAAPARAAGLVDDVVAADALIGAACATASRLGALAPAAWATTKRKLREPALAAWRAAAADGDRAIVDQWCSPATQQAIRQFVEKTLRS